MSTLNKIMKHASRVDASTLPNGDIKFTVQQLEEFVGNIQDAILSDMKSWIDQEGYTDSYNQGIADGMAAVIWLGDYDDEP